MPGVSYVTLNLLFFEIMAIHNILKYLKQIVETIYVNDKESEKIEKIKFGVTNFKGMARKKGINMLNTMECLRK